MDTTIAGSTSCMYMKEMDSKDRPRTKRIERPTPNLKHPIINPKKSKELMSRLDECIEGIDKCKTNANSGEQCAKRIGINLISSDNSLKTNNSGGKRESPAQQKSKLNATNKNSKEVNDPVKSSNTSTLSANQESSNKCESKEDQSGWQRFNAQLMPCCHCRRTFFPHRLPIHERSCRGIGVKRGSKKLQESKATVNTSPVIKSMFLDCSTCGRKYSTTSLTLHELKCRANSSRRVGTEHNEGTNEMVTAWEQFKSQLVACAKCKRKFLVDRLEKHEPICKASPIKH